MELLGELQVRASLQWFPLLEEWRCFGACLLFTSVTDRASGKRQEVQFAASNWRTV